MAFEKIFFCSRCGTRLYKKNNICTVCGFDYKSSEPYGKQPALGAAGIGWSERINDPLFANYQKNSRIYIFIFTAFLSILIPAILFATGELSWDTEGRLVLGVVIGMYFISAFFSIRKTKRMGKEWDGVLENKRFFMTNYGKMKYVLSIRLTDNTLKEILYTDDSTLYDYYRIGDTIRSHQKKNLRTMEKFDKSHDEILFCPSCAYLCDARADYCTACGSPLLKGKR